MEILYSREYGHENKMYEVLFEAHEDSWRTAKLYAKRSFSKMVEGRMEINPGAAWFRAKITVRLKGTNIEGHSYVGGLSYESFDDYFSSPLYSEMVNGATENLESLLEGIGKKIRKLGF